MIKVSWDLPSFRRQLQELSALTGISMAAAVTRTARLWCRDCIRATPPTGRGKLFTSVGAQRKLLESRIVYDVARRAFPLLSGLRMMRDESELKTRVDDLVRRGDLKSVTELLRKRGVLVQHVIAKPNRSLHQRMRSKSGRVTFERGEFLVTDESARDAYVDAVKRRGGRAKSGWATAAKRLGLPKPGWGSHNAPGHFRGITDRQKPVIEFGNRVDFLQSTGYANKIMKWTFNFRMRALQAEVTRFWKAAQSNSLAKLKAKFARSIDSREALE